MTPIWQPNETDKKSSAMFQFAQMAGAQANADLNRYQDLWRWSINHREQFWSLIIDYFCINFHHHGEQILDESDGMFLAKWFTDSQLNFAENLLSFRDQRIAIEFFNENAETQQLTFAQLYEQVSLCRQALQQRGIKSGDRVAAVVPNIPHAVIAMLACSSLGAIWSSCSADFGEQSLRDRFAQIQPKVLLFADGYYYKGRSHHCLEKMQALISHLDCVQLAILIPYLNPHVNPGEVKPNTPHLGQHIFLWQDFIADSKSQQEIKFASLPFNHPLYILYSSGTTGVPKCIVHGAGGTLLQHLKELGLHTNLKPGDKLFYYTSTGWMMWNWAVSALALGVTIVLYDGCPTYPQNEVLLDLVDKQQINVFGCSAKYISALHHAGVDVSQGLALPSLRTLLCTGSPLSAELFEYISQGIKQPLQITSISGGTDLISCFALGNPLAPVYRGELQGPGLAMAVDIFSAQGQSIQQEKGELVCTRAFPSMPIYFWNDAQQKKYAQAYFNRFPAVWTHGDYAQITANQGLIIYGRSDTTLNPGGIRIGTAEIYRQLEDFKQIEDSLVIAQHLNPQQWQDEQRIVLFVQLKPHISLDENLAQQIRQKIHQNASIHHVPNLIIPISDIPRTYNGKLAEKAVSQIVHGEVVHNRSALVNPDALELYKNLPELEQ